MKNYRTHFRQDGKPPLDVKADFLKYDAGMLLFIREDNGKSHVVAVVNAESIQYTADLGPSVGPM